MTFGSLWMIFVVMGPGQKLLTRVRSGQYFVARIVSGQPSMVWVWKISPKNVKFLILFPFGSKNIILAWAKRYSGQRRVGPVGSEPISRYL